jgi:hypothetical protein
MSRYVVTWTIDDEDSETPVEAATRALDAQRLGPVPAVFDVRNTATGELTRVDLTAGRNGAATETLEDTGHWCNGEPVWHEDEDGGEWICGYCENWYPGFDGTPAPASQNEQGRK